jgi:hypothetical protein
MAILFRPIKNEDSLKNYVIENYAGTTEYAEIMKGTPINIVNGALLFFCNLAKELQESIRRFTILQAVKAHKHQTILTNGAGIQQSNELPEISHGV